LTPRTMAMGKWFEDESLWSELYPVLFPEDRLRLGEEEAPKVLRLAGLARATDVAVLDLCCGPGRRAVPLARRGLRVTAVDRSRFLLDHARERARLADFSVEFVETDMREFRRPEAFDVMLSLFTSFGFFAVREEDLHVLRNVRASLKPGGRVCDGHDRQGVAGAALPAHPGPVRSRTAPCSSSAARWSTTGRGWRTSGS